jgi:hypothetical protein
MVKNRQEYQREFARSWLAQDVDAAHGLQPNDAIVLGNWAQPLVTRHQPPAVSRATFSVGTMLTNDNSFAGPIYGVDFERENYDQVLEFLHTKNIAALIDICGGQGQKANTGFFVSFSCGIP